ncbi:DUF6514 family protein [Intestinimonas sp.]|uniref:DUF6514 family protein n=1 Tax=Intestinimonas sp. TaxID=1965293 RepID=UPI002624C764|nr:DUF6514 family protein [Intestinimonas sp.]
MRELFVGARTASGEDGQTHHFAYYILIGQMEVAEHFACESYGVKIREMGGETAAIPDLTVNTERIDGLLELLTRNRVGPAGLRDVVDDWL